MGNDFLGELGETITKTAKEIGEKADVFFESQKLQNKAASEKRMIEKNLSDLGNLVYKRYVDGETMDEELSAVCEEITQHQTVIAKYREEIARLKGRKICGGCGESIDRDSAFCPKCGTPCPPDPEPEVMEGDVVDEDGEVQEPADDAEAVKEEACQEPAADAGEETGDALEEPQRENPEE
ncbi:MAG: zinc ribbon domain-containing protein [Blautia sp.]|jgi:hypothetical protein